MIPTYRHNNVSEPTKTYIHQLLVGIGCHVEDIPSLIARESQGNLYVLMTIMMLIK